jgi:hypothetical protein
MSGAYAGGLSYGKSGDFWHQPFRRAATHNAKSPRKATTLILIIQAELRMLDVLLEDGVTEDDSVPIKTSKDDDVCTPLMRAVTTDVNMPKELFANGGIISKTCPFTPDEAKIQLTDTLTLNI